RPVSDPEAPPSGPPPASTWSRRPPVPGMSPHDVPLAPRGVVQSPAKARVRNGGARRGVAPGLAVLALLLVTGIAGIGLRSPIDVSHAFSSLGAAVGKTPTAPSANGGATPPAPPPARPAPPPDTPL